ncbi:hypothetical protein SHKM778_24530 [Streptomyces sp. KM77-8]|uniref:Uncharacterized protein n=1 Tax=Streptomyces haneummycinicus TaxID=3074435 RepID=A0AAT9HFW7_9ACTN
MEARPGPAPLGGTTLTDWRYGIHDAALASTRGYHPDAAQQEAYDEAMEAGAVDLSGAPDSKVRECAAEVDGQVPRCNPRTSCSASVVKRTWSPRRTRRSSMCSPSGPRA